VVSIVAVISTFAWSGERCTAVTCPMLTFLYFPKVLPGSIPGPRRRAAWPGERNA